jgi:hypothetical protein
MGSLRERTSIKLGNEVRVRGKIKSPSRFFNRRIQDGKRDTGRYE